jgi:hypothetical protein
MGMEWVKFIPIIRLRQNTLQLVAGMNGEKNHGEARQSEDWLATP